MNQLAETGKSIRNKKSYISTLLELLQLIVRIAPESSNNFSHMTVDHFTSPNHANKLGGYSRWLHCVIYALSKRP
jgi:hypothetical protein